MAMLSVSQVDQAHLGLPPTTIHTLVTVILITTTISNSHTGEVMVVAVVAVAVLMSNAQSVPPSSSPSSPSLVLS